MSGLTHLDDTGAARMVDVGGKAVTARVAVAGGRIGLTAQALAAIREGSAKKGDVLATARIAGIMAAKRTAELIPLCHPLPISSVRPLRSSKPRKPVSGWPIRTCGSFWKIEAMVKNGASSRT